MTEEQERLDGGPAADDVLGATGRDPVKRGEALADRCRIVAGQHRHARPAASAERPRRVGGEDDSAADTANVGTVVLSRAKPSAPTWSDRTALSTAAPMIAPPKKHPPRSSVGMLPRSSRLKSTSGVDPSRGGEPTPCRRPARPTGRVFTASGRPTGVGAAPRRGCGWRPRRSDGPSGPACRPTR